MVNRGSTFDVEGFMSVSFGRNSGSLESCKRVCLSIEKDFVVEKVPTK